MAAGKIDDRDITKVAGQLGDWQIIAKHLGFGGQDIEDIETRYQTPAEQRKAVVRNWIRKNGNEATYEALAQVVDEFGDKDCAIEIRALPSKRYQASVNQQGTDTPGAQQTAQPHPQPQPQPHPQPKPPPGNEIKRCKVVIINNKTFLHMSIRTGTDKDAEGLKNLFKEDFRLSVQCHDDLTTEQMHKVLADVAKMDHSSHDCLIVAILSHGDNGKLYGTDSKDGKADPKNALAVESLSTYFDGEKCPTLKGKPKLFILQACRGIKYDKGEECVDGGDAQENMCLEIQAEIENLKAHLNRPQTMEEEDAGHKLPITADILYVYSTAPGYVAWRNAENGSVFIQTFIDVLKQQYEHHHLTDMLTMVNKKVAEEYESSKGYKQMPSFTSQLRETLYFRP